tara:strand:- start:226 stop:1272 length:1047 start_codon:yes stop_codon:yes gene_type:complete
MSTLSFSDLTNLLLENYGALITENLTTPQQGPGNWLVSDQSIMGRLRAAGRVFVGGADSSDRYVRDWAAHTGTSTAASFDGSDNFPAAVQESYADCSIGWKRIGISLEFDNLVRMATRGSAARGGMSPISEDFRRKLKALIHKMETDLAGDGTGNGGKDLDGCKAFMSAANVYAGINQAANAYWQANIDAAGGAALSLNLLENLTGGMWDRNAIGPSAELWMNRNQYSAYTGLFSTNTRYVPGGSVAQDYQAVYDNGFCSLPIRIMAGVPNTEIWFLNLDDLELRFLDHSPADELSSIRDEQTSVEGVPIAFEQVETGKDTKALFMKAYANLVCLNPFKQGAITGLAP